MIASASRDCTVKLWRKDGTFVQTALREERGLVYSVSFSPDGKMITFASDHRTVELWHLDDDQIQTFRGHRD
jgi:WD40 repeat protein